MNKIPSFQKDHSDIMPGLSVSISDKDIITYDLRFVKPNSGKYISYAAIHTIEHIMATLLRNSQLKDNIIYFGPMGCRTGFYLLVRNLDFESTKKLLIDCLKLAENINAIPGNGKNECGNYLEHNLSAAKRHLRKYLKILQD